MRREATDGHGQLNRHVPYPGRPHHGLAVVPAAQVWELMREVARQFSRADLDQEIAARAQAEEKVPKAPDLARAVGVRDEIGIPADDPAEPAGGQTPVGQRDEVVLGTVQDPECLPERLRCAADRLPRVRRGSVVEEHDLVGEGKDGAQAGLDPLLVSTHADHGGDPVRPLRRERHQSDRRRPRRDPADHPRGLPAQHGAPFMMSTRLRTTTA